jgi:hypothetical protein
VLKSLAKVAVNGGTKEGTMSMTDQLLIDLPEIRLPRDLAWRVKFIEAVEDHVKQLGVRGHFEPPRFFGYYFAGRNPVVLARHWKVTLDSAPLLSRLRQILDRMTDHRFNISSDSEETPPDYLLVHDRYDGACWLWGFEQGKRFVEAHIPVAGLNPDEDDEAGGGPKLLGP